jgi:hypothetical protein
VNGTAHHIIIFCRFLVSAFEHFTLIRDEPFHGSRKALRADSGNADMSLVYEQTLCYIRYFVNAAQQGSTMKKTDSPVPHDGLFKTFLGHTDTARDFLEIYLPSALRKICDSRDAAPSG